MTSKWIDEKSNLEQLILVDKLSYEEIWMYRFKY